MGVQSGMKYNGISKLKISPFEEYFKSLRWGRACERKSDV